jgi:hypothetical protein
VCYGHHIQVELVRRWVAWEGDVAGTSLKLSEEELEDVLELITLEEDTLVVYPEIPAAVCPPSDDVRMKETYTTASVAPGWVGTQCRCIMPWDIWLDDYCKTR